MENAIRVSDIAHKLNIKVKVNITVVRQNYRDDFREIICRMNPQRVKAFQVLKIFDANSEDYDTYGVTFDEYQTFCDNHRDFVLRNGQKIIFESSDDMISSYLMLDPLGRVMTNHGQKMSYYDYFEAMDCNIDKILNIEKYLERGGKYNWN